MGDLFHEEVSERFIAHIWQTMANYPHIVFQILTKRAERLSALSHNLPLLSNVWLGVSVEDQKSLYRIAHLRRASAALRFLSIEPLLEDLGEVDLSDMDWVIVGGESGYKARPLHADWVRALRNQCQEKEVAFFFKQWGGVNKKQSGHLLDGRVWEDYPKRREPV
ncbi:DUF5131 family protein [Entomobacter blattae]|uniref:Phage protein Gp37/Gp68 n=1 Tax=Entomobacter blattae TaxID=2762277 RepID=A0A7H1NP64_9PROT|nr:DUF5131 family protein [Entomobacter blattae]QNT77574.1 hypothetical protein JGUZn3_03170 [Entomobacter blattae]